MFCLFPFFAFHTPGGASAPGGHFFAWKAKFLPVLPVPPFFLYSCPAHVAGGLATTSFFTSQLPCPLSLPTPPLSLSLSLSPRAPAPTRRCSEHSVRPTPWPVRMWLTTSFSSPWRAWNYHARLWSVFFFFFLQLPEHPSLSPQPPTHAPLSAAHILICCMLYPHSPCRASGWCRRPSLRTRSRPRW